MSLQKMTKAELIAEINKLGETPPSKWSKVELTTRLCQLYEEKGISYGRQQKTELRKMVVALNQASRKKADLMEFCTQTVGVHISGNHTIPQMQKLALTRIYEMTTPDASDPVGFGKGASLSYAEIKEDKQYCHWVIQTSKEGTCCPQLARLARWLEMPKLQNQTSTS